MSLQKKELGKEQKGLINNLKSNKKSIKKIITKCGVITLLITSFSFVMFPYSYYEVLTGQTENQVISTNDKTIVNDFETVIEKLPDNWKINFDNNLKNLKIYNMPADIRLALNKSVSAYYHPDNRIVVRKEIKDKDNILLHELLHMASNNGNNIGLCSSNYAFSNIANGINEGYTNHLMNSLFNKETTNYNTEMMCAKIFDSIIGTEKMMEYYFTSNHTGLVNNISKIYQDGYEVIYGKIDKKETYLKALELIQIIDLCGSYIKTNNPGEIVKYFEILTDELYNLAICSRLSEDNVYQDENGEKIYSIYLEDDLITIFETLNPNGIYFGNDNNFNDTHSIIVDVNYAPNKVETPKEVLKRLNSISKKLVK